MSLPAWLGHPWITRLVFFVFLLTILWGLRFKLSRTPPPRPAAAPIVSRSPEERQVDWRVSVQRILVDYDRDHDAVRARNSLLTLTVAASDRDTHLSLVLAFQALAEEASQARSKFEKARRAFELP